MQNEERLIAMNSLLIKINKERKRITRMCAEPLGLTMSQIMVLKAANNRPGSIQKELSCETGIATTVLVGILTKMENAGLLCRRTCTDNRRIYQIFLTEMGKQYIKKIDRITVSAMLELTKGFSEEEQALLHSLLLRVYGNCQSAGEEPAREDPGTEL